MASLSTLGLGKTMENKLHSVDINTAEELIKIGSKEAVVRLKLKYPGTCVSILYHLQASIEGTKMKLLSPETKLELKAFFKELP